MPLYTIDIAFDWDSNPKGSYDGFCLLGASGFDLALAGSQVPPGTPGLGRNDQLQFQLWDISDQAATRTVANLVIAFQSAHAATTTQYPFADSAMGTPAGGWYPLANLTLGVTLQSGRSGVYGGPYPNWQISPRPLSFANAGWYFFKAAFSVTTAGVTKVFGNDPEMIVRPAG